VLWMRGMGSGRRVTNGRPLPKHLKREPTSRHRLPRVRDAYPCRKGRDSNGAPGVLQPQCIPPQKKALLPDKPKCKMRWGSRSRLRRQCVRGLTWAFITLFSTGTLLAVLAGQSAQTAAGGRKPDLTQLKKLHHAASMAIVSGQQSLDDPLPPQVRHDFAYQMASAPPDLKNSTTYRELIVKSEDVFAQAGSRVTVSVDAQPRSCEVTYRPIAGGGILSFGTTLAKQRVEPRTYEFTCDCTSPPKPKKIVDCTEDQSVLFECQK